MLPSCFDVKVGLIRALRGVSRGRINRGVIDDAHYVLVFGVLVLVSAVRHLLGAATISASRQGNRTHIYF